MRIHIHHYVHLPEGIAPGPSDQSRVLAALAALGVNMSAVTDAIDRVRAAVEANTSVDQSANVLLTQLAALIRDNTADPAALLELANQLEASNGSLAAAVAANTPVAPAA